MVRTLLILLLAGCPTAEEPPVELVTGIVNLPGGDPLVPRVPGLPFPSDFFLVDDGDGPVIAYPPEALPEGLSPQLFQGDGFSRIPAVLVQFDGGVDPTTLPDPADILATTRPDSPVFVLDEQGEPHPLLVELDVGGNSPLDTALILRPHGALDAATTYTVVLTDRLRSADGSAMEPALAYTALRDGLLTDNDAVEAWRPKFAPALAAMSAADIDPASTVLAWTFTTRSRDDVVAPLAFMQQVMEAVELPPPTILSDGPDDGDRRISGTFEAPDFLNEDRQMEVVDGVPTQFGTRDVPFLVSIPPTVTEPRPVIAFGHGFFSSREEITWGSLDAGLERWAMSGASIDFDGFSEADLASTAAILAGDLNGLPSVIHQQVQNVATFTLLARLIREHLSVDVPELDGDALHYMGISNGGTQGLTIMSTSPAFSRGALVVPGGGWTHMIQRAVQFGELGAVISDRYDQPLQLQLAIALLQFVFDPADSLNYVDQLPADREITLHMAVHDSQVANLVTEWVARTANIPLVEPSPVVIPGLETVTAEAPAGAAVTQALLVYAEDVDPPPPGNQPPAQDNGTHDDVRSLESYQQQMGEFLETGRIVQVCNGPCDPN